MGLAFCAILIYAIVFFRAPFTPLSALFENGVSRVSLFSFLMNPEFFFSLWFGESGEFALLDRIPIFLGAGLCLCAASGLGILVLRLFRVESTLGICERYVFSSVLGLGLFSVFLHLLALSGAANAVIFVRCITGAFCIAGLYGFATWKKEILRDNQNNTEKQGRTATREKIGYGILAISSVPLMLLYLLTFPLPPVEYDVLSYHLPGVKETFLSGYFGFRTDSVYTNMPFGANMCYLWGMLLADDWYTGALVGKTVLGFTSLLTALGLFSFCARFFSRCAGYCAGLVYLATPWTFYLSVTGLIDGVVGMYLFLAAYCVVLTPKVFSFSKGALFAGLFTGCAIACKYPAALFVFLPVGCWLLVKMRFNEKRDEKIAAIGVVLMCFCIGVFLTCGSWFVKNYAFTGNPTYPLLHGVFGDSTGNWTAEKNERWKRVHGPKDHSLSSLKESVKQVVYTSDYHAPMLVPFALLGLVPLWKPGRHRRKAKIDVAHENDAILFPLLLYVLFVLLCWWALTHRLDRFWIPVLPLCCVLAARGMTLYREKGYTIAVCVFLGFGLCYATLLAALPQPGKYNRLFLSQAAMRIDPVRVMPWVNYFNENRPKGTLLLIGDAKAFDFQCPVIFSSCFDDTPFERLVCGDHAPEFDEPELIRRRFHELGITDIYVDWNEIARFRSPGNYGFPDFVQKEVFERLVHQGVLKANVQEFSGNAYRVVEHRE